MDITLILKIAGVGVLVASAAQILSKSGRDEQATLVTVAGIIVALLLIVGEIGKLFSSVRGIFGF
ncbi:stage III sporulation protein AC [Anaerotruncus sp. CAG:390]|nr:stage III sporulation protein AC [Anaerotruncus sp. CAG:390]